MKTNTIKYRRATKVLPLFFSFIFQWSVTFAQTEPVTVAMTSDTNRTIEIVGADNLRQITISNSTVLQTLAGHAKVRQGNTLLEGDSIVLDKTLGIAEVFGHVHINDADTVNTYSQYLRYIGNEQMAYLKGDVRLSDGKAKVITNELEYNLKTGIATYKNGGQVINEKTTLTSQEGIYYSDTKDVIFKNNVHLRDAKYNMSADSLRYNTEFKNAYFISPTHIVSDNGTIDTQSGNYNLETGEAVFFDRTVIRDSSRLIVGNKVAFDEKTDQIQIEGNGKFVDSSNSIIVLGNQILIDKKQNSFLATRKPVMILYQKNDSTYIAADTLFSGKMNGTQKKLSSDSAININSRTTKDSLSGDSIRYFIGYHHVRIFNDSLQAVSDSLHYATDDSIFRLIGKPVCWNENTQLTADTIHLLTEKQQAKQVKLFYNAMVINKTKEGLYNQMTGNTMNGYFREGQLDHIRTKGSPAEAIFYPQDEDSAYVGMNRSKGDAIDILFKDKAIHKIKFINDVDGTLYPMSGIPGDQRYFKGFSWEELRRPKSKLELFE